MRPVLVLILGLSVIRPESDRALPHSRIAQGKGHKTESLDPRFVLPRSAAWCGLVRFCLRQAFAALGRFRPLRSTCLEGVLQSPHRGSPESHGRDQLILDWAFDFTGRTDSVDAKVGFFVLRAEEVVGISLQGRVCKTVVAFKTFPGRVIAPKAEFAANVG